MVAQNICTYENLSVTTRTTPDTNQRWEDLLSKFAGYRFFDHLTNHGKATRFLKGDCIGV